MNSPRKFRPNEFVQPFATAAGLDPALLALGYRLWSGREGPDGRATSSHLADGTPLIELGALQLSIHDLRRIYTQAAPGRALIADAALAAGALVAIAVSGVDPTDSLIYHRGAHCLGDDGLRDFADGEPTSSDVVARRRAVVREFAHSMRPPHRG